MRRFVISTRTLSSTSRCTQVADFVDLLIILPTYDGITTSAYAQETLNDQKFSQALHDSWSTMG